MTMKAHTQANVTISLNESDVEQLLEGGKLEDDGIVIELF